MIAKEIYIHYSGKLESYVEIKTASKLFVIKGYLYESVDTSVIIKTKHNYVGINPLVSIRLHVFKHPIKCYGLHFIDETHKNIYTALYQLPRVIGFYTLEYCVSYDSTHSYYIIFKNYLDYVILCDGIRPLSQIEIIRRLRDIPEKFLEKKIKHYNTCIIPYMRIDNYFHYDYIKYHPLLYKIINIIRIPLCRYLPFPLKMKILSMIFHV